MLPFHQFFFQPNSSFNGSFKLMWLCTCMLRSRYSGYVLTLPQQLQIGAAETICLTLYNVSNTIQINLNISCYGREVSYSYDTFQNGKYTIPSKSNSYLI